MSSHDVSRIERSTVSEAFGDRESSPGIGASETEKTFPEVPPNGQVQRNEDLESCGSEDTLPGENNFDSPKSDDESLDFNVGRCTFDLALNIKDQNFDQQIRIRSPRAQSRYPVLEIERDSEENTGLHLVDSRCTDSSGGVQLMAGDSHTSANVSQQGYCAIEAESHVTKLQSFVDSLATLTEPSYVARPQPPFIPQYPKITPTKASACIGSHSGSGVRSGFPYFGYQSPVDERSLATTPMAFLSPLEQPLDLSTKKNAGFSNDESRCDRSSELASPEVRKRCLERPETLLQQADLLRQRISYDTWNRSATSRPVLSELEHATSPRSVSYSAAKHRSSDAGQHKRERSSFGEFATSKAAQMYTKSDIVYPIETKNTAQHLPTDDTQRSSVAGKRKYSTFDEGSAHEGGEHSPGSEAISKCQRQSVRYSGNSSHERGEALMPRKEDKEYMNMKCSCGTRFESLYHLAIHIERSGHVPGSLRPESLADLPKLVRGQDVWMSQGPEQAELILRCVQCRTSFRSLPELTVHMIRTKHYVNIVGTDGSAGQMDYGDPPREKESPQSGSLKDSRKKNDAYMPTVRDVSERSVEMVQQRLQKNKSPRHNDEATEASVGMNQIQSASYSGRNQLNSQSSCSGRGSTEGVSEVEHKSDQCQEYDANRKQLPAAPEEISGKEQVDPTAVALDESKEESRTEIRRDQSLRRHSLASKLHSKISSVTSNIQERIDSKQSTNSKYSTGAHHMNSVSLGKSRNKTRVLKDACGNPEEVSDTGVARSSAEKHSSTGVSRIQSPDCKDAVKSLEPTCGLSDAKGNDGNRRNKRVRDTDYETENGRTEKKSKSQSGFWKPGHQLPKDPNSPRSLIRERQPEMAPSTQDLRKERLLLNVSRWIASTELETKRDCVETQMDDLDPVDNRMELVSPPPQPVETSSILVAIKNFVDSSFCGQTFASGSQLSNRTTFSSSSFPSTNPVPTGRNFPEMTYPPNLIPGAGDICESPSRSSLMKRKAHLDVQASDPTERKAMRAASEKQNGRCSDVNDPSSKQPLTVALRDVSKVNTQQNSEDDYPEVPSYRDLTASPPRHRKSEYSDSINLRRLEGSEPQSESLFGRYCSGSEAEDGRQSVDATAVQPAPSAESKPNEDSSDTVDLEECSSAAQSAEMISREMDTLAVDSTTKSQKPSSPSPVGIVSTAYALPDDPLRDRSSDRKSISKPISFFLSTRSFEKVC